MCNELKIGRLRGREFGTCDAFKKDSWSSEIGQRNGMKKNPVAIAVAQRLATSANKFLPNAVLHVNHENPARTPFGAAFLS